MNGQRFLYLEHDGKVLLVDDDGIGPQLPVPGREVCDCERGWKMRLPTEEEARLAGLTWKEKRVNRIPHQGGSLEVVIAYPEIEWPRHWAWKDAVISDSGVHPLARESVYRSLHRLVTKVVIQNENDEVLLAKVKRGFFKGLWTLPGGYLDHGEHPRIGAQREILEELGLEIEIDEDSEMDLQERVFLSSGIAAGLDFVSFTYRHRIVMADYSPTLKEDEIEAAEWFSKDEAIQKSASWFDQQVIVKL